jgi:predicted NAD/FAD-binding protein
MKIAIVGSGVSGLVCAHLLHRAHDVALFEGGDHVGGHTHTNDVEIDGRRVAVDTGFIVYNEETYPRFVRLLARLGVRTHASDMSFSVKDARTGLEWRGTSLDTLFAQRLNALRPSFHRMLKDVVRFNAEARALAADGPDDVPIGQWIEERGYSREFVEHYLVPLGSAIWSADPSRFGRFPARTFARFFENHRFLQVAGQPAWRTVTGGARSYVEAIVRPLGERVRRARVISIRRNVDDAGRAEVVAEGLGPERFDRVIVATHSDEALRLLYDPTPAEREILGAIPYQENVALLHTDARVMPRTRRAWASWNAWIPPAPRSAATLTYDMNRLQALETPEPLLVSLNMEPEIDPAKVLRRIVYHHPVFTPEGARAQRRHAELNGANGTHYAGAYWGYGFHEDGVASAVAVCERLGETL